MISSRQEICPDRRKKKGTTHMASSDLPYPLPCRDRRTFVSRAGLGSEERMIDDTEVNSPGSTEYTLLLKQCIQEEKIIVGYT